VSFVVAPAKTVLERARKEGIAYPRLHRRNLRKMPQQLISGKVDESHRSGYT